MPSGSDDHEILEHLGRLASEVGPAFAPISHEELLRSIIETARSVFGGGAGSLALLDEETDELVFHVAAGGGEVVGIRMPASHGIAGWVIASGQPIAIDDVASDPRFAADVAEKTGYTPRSILAAPLETEHQIIGVLSILDPRPTEGRDEMDLLGVFAGQAALALESQRVFGNLGRTLFAAAARATDSNDLAGQLELIAGAAVQPSADMARLAAHFSALSRLGPAERATAIKLIGDLLDYVRGRVR